MHVDPFGIWNGCKLQHFRALLADPTMLLEGLEPLSTPIGHAIIEELQNLTSTHLQIQAMLVGNSNGHIAVMFIAEAPFEAERTQASLVSVYTTESTGMAPGED